MASYSGGMRRRLDLAASLVAEASVIFLDEPTTGLEPRSRQAEEADRLPDLVAVLDRGRVVAEGTSAELKRRVGEQRLDLVLSDARAFDEAATLLDGRVLVRTFVPVDTMPSWIQGLAEHQPVTPVTETVRALLLGGSAGGDAWPALAWCAAILALSVTASSMLLRRRTAR